MRGLPQGKGIVSCAFKRLQDGVRHPGQLRLGVLQHLARLGRHKYQREVQLCLFPMTVKKK